jgi:hypothetical protein
MASMVTSSTDRPSTTPTPFSGPARQGQTKNAVTSLDEEFQRISGACRMATMKLNNALADAAKRVNRRD